jgi:hypothetical protein
VSQDLEQKVERRRDGAGKRGGRERGKKERRRKKRETINVKTSVLPNVLYLKKAKITTDFTLVA